MWDLVGHDEAVARLSGSLARRRLAHAYLISGPARIGKSTLARRLAQAALCAEPAPPCRQCSHCRRVESGNHPDAKIVVFQPADASQEEEQAPEGAAEGKKKKANVNSLGIESIKEIIHEASFSPYEAPRKVYAILNAEMLTVPAQNSLLKLLEEPPPAVVLLLTVADANMLLPTIVSRCQQIRLQPVPVAPLAAYLRQRGVAGEKAELLARLSTGRAGWAIEAAENNGLLVERAEALERLLGLVEAGVGRRLAVAGQLAGEFGRQRQSVNLSLEVWQTWWRDVLLVQAGAPELASNYDRLEALTSLAQRGSPARTRAYLARIEAARAQLEQNVNSRLAFESLLLAIPGTGAN
ncbi:MAG: DNA polymerase III subunit [Chloroflexota bacterium]